MAEYSASKTDLKILFLLHPSGLMDRDMAYGFKKAGVNLCIHILRLGKTPEGHSVQFFAVPEMIRMLDDFRPDMIFSFNGYGLDDKGILAEEYARRKIPFVTWYVDMPRTTDIGGNYAAPNSHLFVFERDYIPLLKSKGFENVHYLPLATNPDRFRPLEIPRQNNVCFVGDSGYSTIRYISNNIDALLAPDAVFLGAVENAVRMQMAGAEQDTAELIRGALVGCGCDFDACSETVRNLLEAFVEREASLRLRLEIMRRVAARFDLVVYGDDLWASVAGKGYRGKAHYFRNDIVEVYNASAVYLNVSKFQLKKAVNQRPFDIAACGGFVISDERNDLKDLFQADEVVTYGDTEDLLAKIRYYLDNENERLKIAERAGKRVLRDHTYVHRVREILRCVKEARGF